MKRYLIKGLIMVEGFNPVRYSVIEDKNPREIVMLVGDGCKWRKCRFCDYHLDSSNDIEANYKMNKAGFEVSDRNVW